MVNYSNLFMFKRRIKWFGYVKRGEWGSCEPGGAIIGWSAYAFLGGVVSVEELSNSRFVTDK